jgi:hypothetical protein
MDTVFALDRLAKDRMASVQELADEAFRDLLPADHAKSNAAGECSLASMMRFIISREN